MHFHRPQLLNNISLSTMPIKHLINHLPALTLCLLPVIIRILHPVHDFLETIAGEVHLVIRHEDALLLLGVACATDAYGSVLFFLVHVLDCDYALKASGEGREADDDDRAH